jgi:nucleotide-binding universal stress UspA family protein
MRRSYRRFLVPIDFSAGSRAALVEVERLLTRVGSAQLHLVHAVEPVTPDVSIAGATVWTDVTGQIERSAREEIGRLAARVQARLGRAVRVRTHVALGPPYLVICRLAAKVRADLIVLGTHGRTGLRHVLLGSVAERVVRHAGRPVLVVPLGKRRG